MSFWAEEEYAAVKQRWRSLDIIAKSTIIVLWFLGYLVIYYGSFTVMSLVFWVSQGDVGKIILPEIRLLYLMLSLPAYYFIYDELADCRKRQREVFSKRCVMAVLTIMLLMVLMGRCAIGVSIEAFSGVISVIGIVFVWPIMFIGWTAWFIPWFLRKICTIAL